jgi:hypothetical protein
MKYLLIATTLVLGLGLASYDTAKANRPSPVCQNYGGVMKRCLSSFYRNGQWICRGWAACR